MVATSSSHIPARRRGSSQKIATGGPVGDGNRTGRLHEFPSHLVQTSRNSDDGLVAGCQPVLISVERLHPSDVEGVHADTWFVGRIPPEVEIQDIKGMSGGPIYGLRKSETGQWSYNVIALQSWWRKKSRTTFGCSLPAFAEALHGVMSES